MCDFKLVLGYVKLKLKIIFFVFLFLKENDIFLISSYDLDKKSSLKAGYHM